MLGSAYSTQASNQTISVYTRLQGALRFSVVIQAPQSLMASQHPYTGTHHIPSAYRYQQIGNAVSPLVAAALGRGLLVAARREAPPAVEDTVQYLPSPELTEVTTLVP